MLGVVVGLTLFGLMGGLALGLAYRYVPDFRTLIPETRGWQIFRNVTLGFLVLLVLIAVYNIVSTFTIRPATLADRLTLPTQGVHWRSPDAPLSLTDAPDPALEAVCESDGQVTVRVDGIARAQIAYYQRGGDWSPAATGFLGDRVEHDLGFKDWPLHHAGQRFAWAQTPSALQTQ